MRPASALLGYAGDNYQHAWFLWHFAKAVSNLQNPFYTNLIYYPNRVNLAWSTTDPLAGALSLPISLTTSPAVAYNLALILQLALAAFFARLLCFRICGQQMAAILGGMAFGFSPYLMAHALGHLSLVTAFPIPLFVLLLDRVLEGPCNSLRFGLMLGLAWLLTAAAHYNYTVFCCLFGLVIVTIEIILKGSEVLARTWKEFAVATVVFLIGFLPLLRMLLKGPSLPPIPRGMSHLTRFSADALGFAIPSWNHVLLGHFVRKLDLRFFVAGFEGTVYIGPIVLLLAILGAWKGRQRHRKWVIRAIAGATVFYLLSLGPRIHFLSHDLGIPGPAAVLYRIPFAEFISAPARFDVIVALCLAILLSLGVTFLIERFRSNWQKRAVVAVVGLLLLADYLTIPFPRSSVFDPAASFDDRAAQACVLPKYVDGGAALTFPLVKAPYCMKSMWMQASEGGRYALVDGYLSYSPESTWTGFSDTSIVRSLLSLEGILNFPVVESADRSRLPEAIRKMNLRAFVVFDSPQQDLGVSYGRSVFGGSGSRSGSCTVFEILPDKH